MINAKQNNAIQYLSFSRVEKKNAITLNMYQQLADGIKRACADDSVKVIVLSGEGGNFSTGNDLADFLSNPSIEEESSVYQFLMALATCELPVVAAVEGFAIGVGCTLLLHCEQVFAAENAVFSLPFVNLGLVPEGGSSLLLPRQVGYQKAAKWLLTGDAFSALEAEQAGFVAEVTAEGEALDKAIMFAHNLARKPRGVLVESKRLMRGDDAGLSERMHEELKSFVEFLNGAAAKEAMNAFLEKREADFSNL